MSAEKIRRVLGPRLSGGESVAVEFHGLLEVPHVASRTKDDHRDSDSEKFQPLPYKTTLHVWNIYLHYIKNDPHAGK